VPKKYMNSATTGVDILNAINAIKGDLNLQVRVTITGATDQDMGIEVEVYQDINGVKIGVARNKYLWDAGDVPLLTRVMHALHQGYWAAEVMAHRKMSKADRS